MRALWYGLVVILGVIGALALLRAVEHLATGGGVAFVQFLIGVLFLFGAWQALRRARAR